MLRTAQLLIGRQIAQVLGTHPHARAIVARIDHLEDGTFTWSTGSCAPSSSTVSALGARRSWRQGDKLADPK